MNDLDTIRKLNRSVIGDALREAEAKGKFAVVTSTGLNAVSAEVVDTQEEAKALVERIRSRGYGYTASVHNPPARESLLPAA